MVSKAKQMFLLLIYFLSPIIASIIYWIEEPLDGSDLMITLIHRSGSILGIFSFIWMCFNIIIMTKIKLIEKNFSLDGLILFHNRTAAVAIVLGTLHYPLVRLGRTFSQIQIRSGTLGWATFLSLMVLALIFMSNRLIKNKKIEKLRLIASRKKFRYKVNKVLHNITMLGVIVIFVHTLLAYTSAGSVLMRGVYIFFFAITFIGWVYHKLIRRFRSESDPYVYRKASWDVVVSEIISETNKEWALSLIKQNPSLYPCLQCGTCTEHCPVSEITKGDYNPRSNILGARFGYKDLLLGGDELGIWGCTICDTCNEVCPQNIELTEIFTFLKNQSIALGKGPEFVYSQIKAVFDNAKAIPSQPAIERRREQLGLPAVVAPNVNEVQTLLRNLEIDKKLK